MNELSGYLKLARAILMSDDFIDGRPMTKRDAYLELCLLANYGDSEQDNNGEIVMLHRGQLLVSTPYLMKRFRWGNTAVRTFLKELEQNGYITVAKQVGKQVAKQPRKQVITIEKYDFSATAKQVTKQVPKQVTEQVIENERKEAKESKSNCYSDTSYPSNSLEVNKNNNTVTDDFDEFWAAYPKKVDKYVAKQSYIRARQKATADEIMRGLNRYKQYIQAEQTEKQFIANASTWLNQHRWENQYEIEKKPDTAPIKKTGFHNFQERHTDYDKLFGQQQKRA